MSAIASSLFLLVVIMFDAHGHAEPHILGYPSKAACEETLASLNTHPAPAGVTSYVAACVEAPIKKVV